MTQMGKLSREDLQRLVESKYGNTIRFSEKIGVSEPTIRRGINKGFYDMQLGNANKIRMGLELSFEELIGTFPTTQAYPFVSVNKKAKELYNLYLDSGEAQSAIDSLLGYSAPAIDKILERRIASYGGKVKFAEAIGMPKSTLATIFKNGIETATVNNVCKICFGLNLTLDEFVGEREQHIYDGMEANRFYALYEKNPNTHPAINMLLKIK